MSVYGTAMYDNPSTYRREWWVDGKVVRSVSFELLLTKGNEELTAAKIVPLKIGQILGNENALRLPN